MQALGCGFSLAPEPGSNTEVPLMPGGDHRQPLHLSSFALFARELGDNYKLRQPTAEAVVRLKQVWGCEKVLGITFQIQKSKQLFQKNSSLLCPLSFCFILQ